MGDACSTRPGPTELDSEGCSPPLFYDLTLPAEWNAASRVRTQGLIQLHRRATITISWLEYVVIPLGGYLSFYPMMLAYTEDFNVFSQEVLSERTLRRSQYESTRNIMH